MPLGNLQSHQWFIDSAAAEMLPNIYGFLDLVLLVYKPEEVTHMGNGNSFKDCWG